MPPVMAASTYRMYFSGAKIVIIFETTKIFRVFFNMTQKNKERRALNPTSLMY